MPSKALFPSFISKPRSIPKFSTPREGTHWSVWIKNSPGANLAREVESQLNVPVSAFTEG